METFKEIIYFGKKYKTSKVVIFVLSLLSVVMLIISDAVWANISILSVYTWIIIIFFIINLFSMFYIFSSTKIKIVDGRLLYKKFYQLFSWREIKPDEVKGWSFDNEGSIFFDNWLRFIPLINLHRYDSSVRFNLFDGEVVILPTHKKDIINKELEKIFGDKRGKEDNSPIFYKSKEPSFNFGMIIFIVLITFFGIVGFYFLVEENPFKEPMSLLMPIFIFCFVVALGIGTYLFLIFGVPVDYFWVTDKFFGYKNGLRSDFKQIYWGDIKSISIEDWYYFNDNLMFVSFVLKNGKSHKFRLSAMDNKFPVQKFKAYVKERGIILNITKPKVLSK